MLVQHFPEQLDNFANNLIDVGQLPVYRWPVEAQHLLDDMRDTLRLGIRDLQQAVVRRIVSACAPPANTARS